MTSNTADSAPKTLVFLPLAELLLTLLPLLVLSIVELSVGKGLRHVLSSPEWSFAASVLFGLSVFKIVTGIVKPGTGSWEFAGLLVVLVIVVGLVPSLVVLALCLVLETPATPLVYAQVALLLASAAVFLFAGILNHYGLFHAVDIRHDGPTT